MVMTPVGARCRECAGLKRLPTYHVPATYYFRAIGAGLISAIAIGIAWHFITLLLHGYLFSLFQFMVFGAAGYAVAVAISFAVNKKRGWALALIGGCSFLLSYIVQLVLSPFGFLSAVMFSGWGSAYLLLSLTFGFVVAASQLR
jgi:hypothetical protein